MVIIDTSILSKLGTVNTFLETGPSGYRLFELAWQLLPPDGVDTETGLLVSLEDPAEPTKSGFSCASQTIADCFFADDKPPRLTDSLLAVMQADFDENVEYESLCSRYCPELWRHDVLDSRDAAAERYSDPGSWAIGRPLTLEWFRRMLPYTHWTLGLTTQEAIDASWKRKGFFYKFQLSLTGMLLYGVLLRCDWDLQKFNTPDEPMHPPTDGPTPWRDMEFRQ